MIKLNKEETNKFLDRVRQECQEIVGGINGANRNDPLSTMDAIFFIFDRTTDLNRYVTEKLNKSIDF